LLIRKNEILCFRGKLVKINEDENELTRRISTGSWANLKKFHLWIFFLSVIETSVTTNTEQERDLRRHSHIGTFRRGLSKQNSN
jgi:hypothetical protein